MSTMSSSTISNIHLGKCFSNPPAVVVGADDEDDDDEVERRFDFIVVVEGKFVLVL